MGLCLRSLIVLKSKLVIQRFVYLLYAKYKLLTTCCFIRRFIQVVQGLDLAVPLMDEGEIAEVEVHPRFGYGTIGKEPDVPPSSVLMYTIELLKSEPEPEFDEMSIEKRQEFGLVKNEKSY